jgi:hypothetical protein
MTNSYFPSLSVSATFSATPCEDISGVCCDLGTRDELVVFTIKLLLNATVEEEGYVRVLLGF